MTSLVINKDNYSIPPEGWNLKWENPSEIEKQKEIKEQEDRKEFNNWKDEHMKDYNEDDYKNKKLYLYMGQRESTYLGNIYYIRLR